jgi:SNF2 family DNA or RNA helicase
MKKEVALELPEKSEHTLTLPMHEQQESLYLSLRDYYRSVLEKLVKSKGAEQNRFETKTNLDPFYDKSFFLEGLLRLRQVSCHPTLVKRSPKRDLINDFDPSEATSNKLEFLLEKVKTLVATGHKAIVFSQFTSLLQLFFEPFNENGIPFEYLDGQSQERLAIVERFHSNPQTPILLASIKAGGLGLNLTAADYCFILDPWWNPAVEQQAVDRIYRIGQKKPVSIYRIVSQGSVEEKMILLQAEKQKIAEQLLTADHDFLDQLSFTDFQFLFSS